MNTSSLNDLLGPEFAPWLAPLLVLLVLVATLEGLVLARRRAGGYDWRAYASTLGDVALRRAVDALGLSLAAPVLMWAWQHRLATQAMDTVAAVVALFVLTELLYYVYHRSAHRVRWFWASHAVHHSPTQLSLATAMRLGATAKLTGTGLFFAPLLWLGFSPQAVAASLAFNLVYQFWIHAEWIPKLWAPIEWLFNTPSHHRVHHASNPEYLDCNYGGVLIVFDRLFGSFEAERPAVKPRYGLSTPLHTYNPLRIAVHEWVRLGGDLAAARGPAEALRTLFGPPRAARALRLRAA